MDKKEKKPDVANIAEIVKAVKIDKKPEIKKVKTVRDYYSMGEWRGFPQYKCNVCPFDSLNEKTIKDHIIDRHIPKPVRPKVSVIKFDRHGKEVIEKNK